MTFITEDKPAKPEPFCSFCLRERPQNVEFYKHVIGASEEMRNSLQSMLGYDFNLANFAICKPCWKVIQLIQDFRLRCFKANEVVQRMTKGLSNDVDDGWFSAKNLATIESVRMGVQDQMRHIEKINVTRRTLLLDDSTEEIEDHQSSIEEESIESEITIGETKIESSDDNVVTPVNTESTHQCTICFERLPSLVALSDHLLKHPTSDSVKCKMFCDMRFTSCEARAQHSRVCADRPRTCTVCGMVFPNRDMVRLHCKEAHPDESSFACGTCGKRFRRKGTQLTHERIAHTEYRRIYPCAVCGKMFGYQEQARAHAHQMHSIVSRGSVLEE
ncbi:zinc finger protein 250-like [Culex quinquefasciatus]|uniref:zinc finger protein 250-like n=1 Tax=Culex quinquefasciatus TaxID=7176 RepID=UPI0018E2A867|nr:zinc finger protein 250-like [Culex quinquefasciatus]